MTLKERMEKLEIEVISLQAEKVKEERKAQCCHNYLRVKIDDDGYVFKEAICRTCGRTLKRKDSGFTYSRSVKRIFRLFK